jgi:serine protease AprX
MLLHKLRVVSGAFVTAVLAAVVGAVSFPEFTPAGLVAIGAQETRDEKKPSQQKDSGDLVSQKDKAALAHREVLCDRTQFFISGTAGNGLNAPLNIERTAGTKNVSYYGLSSVTVPSGGWKIDTIAIYTVYSREPKAWLKVNRARLNVFPKEGDVPTAKENPRDGREVEVTVREVEKIRDGAGPVSVYEVRAANLNLTLGAGECWIGLTPISTEATVGASHLGAGRVRDARFPDVMLDRMKWKIWPTEESVGVHLSIRIEGWRIPRGQVLDWQAEKDKGAKQLHLRLGTFDPVADPPKVAKELAAPEDCKLWIVQCRESVDQQARDQLTQAGATLLRYLPDDAYIVRLAPEAVKKVREIAAVRWVGPYHPAYRLDPTVFPANSGAKRGLNSAPRHEREGERQVLIYLFDRDEGAKKLVAQVVRDAGGKVVFQSPKGYYLAANLPLDKLATLARCDAVCAVERRFGAFELRFPMFDVNAGNSLKGPNEKKRDKGLISLSEIRELCGAEAVKKAGGYEGLGVRVAFWDNGVRRDHIDLSARPLTVIGPAQWTNSGHGTEIASILCGEGRGDPRARGLLPLGGLVFAIEAGDPVHEDRYGLVERFVRDHDVVVVSNSTDNWGRFALGHDFKRYDGYMLLLDDLVWEYDLLICECIGNIPGNDIGHSGSWAKNVLNIGGVHPRGSLRREDHSPRGAQGVGLTIGPAPDGRVKPDLVHFASDYFAAASSSPRAYGPFGGTSGATPLVAGHCGLMMEMWADGVFGNLPPGRTVSDRKPHAATAKALMINSAYRYPIDDQKPVFTRFQQGWGMPDLGRLYESRKKMFIVDQEIALRDHQAVEYKLRVPENEPELRVTMVYTDPLGTTAATKALVNDLDLIVISPDGKRYLGNHGLLEGNISKEGGAPDRLNNVENVFLNKPAPGVWRVIVAAHRIAWDQHRATAAWDQDFGLVVSGVEPIVLLTEPLSK